MFESGILLLTKNTPTRQPGETRETISRQSMTSKTKKI